MYVVATVLSRKLSCVLLIHWNNTKILRAYFFICSFGFTKEIGAFIQVPTLHESKSEEYYI